MWSSESYLQKGNKIAKAFNSSPRFKLISLVGWGYLICNVLNYACLYTFETRLPSTDVVSYLHGARPDLSSTLNNTLSLPTVRTMYNIVRDVYLRNEDFYLDHRDDLTITLTPTVSTNKHSASVNLMDGLYNFTANSKISINPQLGTLFKLDAPFNVFNFKDYEISKFVNNTIHGFYSTTTLGVKPALMALNDLDKFRFLTHLSNILILFASSLLFILLISSLALSDSTLALLTWSMVVSIVLAFITVLSFQFLNLVVVIHCNWNTADGKFLKKFFLSAAQCALSVLLSYKLYFYLVDLIVFNLDEIIDNYKSESMSRENSGYPLAYDETDDNCDSNVNHDPLKGSDGNVSGSIAGSRFSEHISESSSVYSDNTILPAVNVSTAPTTFDPKTATAGGSHHNVINNHAYSGPIQRPQSAYSLRRNRLALQGNHTAPEPFNSPESESSGFEQLRRELMHSSDQTGPKSIPFSLGQESSPTKSINSTSIKSLEYKQLSGEDLTLKRVPANIDQCKQQEIED